MDGNFCCCFFGWFSLVEWFVVCFLIRSPARLCGLKRKCTVGFCLVLLGCFFSHILWWSYIWGYVKMEWRETGTLTFIFEFFGVFVIHSECLVSLSMEWYALLKSTSWFVLVFRLEICSEHNLLGLKRALYLPMTCSVCFFTLLKRHIEIILQGSGSQDISPVVIHIGEGMYESAHSVFADFICFSYLLMILSIFVLVF